MRPSGGNSPRRPTIEAIIRTAKKGSDILKEQNLSMDRCRSNWGDRMCKTRPLREDWLLSYTDTRKSDDNTFV